MNNIENKIVKVRLMGGIIGLFSSPKDRLENEMKSANAEGWRTVQIIPQGSGNILVIILRLILLLMTIFLFTLAQGYYIILERSK